LSAAEATPPLPAGLLFCCADDDVVPRMLCDALLQSVGADVRSLIVGETYEQLIGLPRTCAEFAVREGPQHVIVILDENMHLPGAPELYGTTLCRELREVHDFRGVVIIHSANDDPEAQRAAADAGADALVGKGVGGLRGVADAIARAHQARFPDFLRSPRALTVV
jgi:CheY-like chemotaxis protein